MITVLHMAEGPNFMWGGVLSEQQKLISDDCCICFGIYFGLLHIRRRPEDEGGGGNFYGNEIGAGWRHGVFKWIRLGDIGLCSVTDTGCQEDQQLPHTHYWGGREGGGRFLSSSTPLCIRVSHSALTKDLGAPQLLSKKLLRPDLILNSWFVITGECWQADHHDLQGHHSDPQSNHNPHGHDHHDLHDDWKERQDKCPLSKGRLACCLCIRRGRCLCIKFRPSQCNNVFRLVYNVE